MGLILVDTSIFVDNLRGTPEAGDALDQAKADQHQLMASVLTKIELLAGMRAHEKREPRDLVTALTWIAVNDEIAELAGADARAYRRSHQGIGVVDFVIAATAKHLDAQLWTNNVRHYPMFPDLKPPY